jgi:putrescine aminotransferase
MGQGDRAPDSRKAAESALRRIEQHLSPGTALTAKVLGSDAIEASARGATIMLSDGRQMIDFGSYGVALFGHRNPTVLRAVARELECMPTSSRVLANPTTAAFVAELSGRFDGTLPRVWLGSDGSDAVEAAAKLARRATGRTRILAVDGGFHGKTLGALALTTNAAFREGVEGVLAGVSRIPPDDPEAVCRETDQHDIAAVIFEPIQGEAGVRPIDVSVLRRWSADAHCAGAFVISDEIQAGLGRCGPLSLAVDAGLHPDGVLLGKALGGGVVPLSALLASEALAEPLVADPTWHSITFGGHPLACAAGRGALIALDECHENGRQVGRRMEVGLQRLAKDNPDVIAQVRGVNLMWGIQFATAGAAGAALLELSRRGLLISPCLSSKDVIRLLPPMVTPLDDVDRALEILADAIPALASYV